MEIQWQAVSQSTAISINDSNEYNNNNNKSTDNKSQRSNYTGYDNSATALKFLQQKNKRNMNKKRLAMTGVEWAKYIILS